MSSHLGSYFQYARSLATLVALGSLCACSGEAPDMPSALGGQRAAVELHDLAETFDFAFVPPAPLAPDEPLSALRDRLRRSSFPVQATGAIIMPIHDAAGAPVFNAGIPARATCGATLISPSHVVTAAHCVDDMTVFRPESDPVTLQLYRPTRKLARDDIWRPKTVLSGTFPEYRHESFSAADGYFVDDYRCKVASRCFSDFHCPAGSSGKDLALLECEGRPGDRYGYLNVATIDRPNALVHVPWKHEVYDIPHDTPESSDLFKHYVKYPASHADNYHYLDRSQLLPLMSSDWADGTRRRKVSTTNASLVWTDVLACHGTSGSGFLQEEESTGAWELVGPTIAGGASMSGLLCGHAPGLPGRRAALPGEAHIGYASLRIMKPFLDALPAWRAACDTQVEHGFALGGRTACQREGSGLALEARSSYADFDPFRSPVLRLSAGTVELGEVKLEQGEAYRVAVSGVPGSGCSVSESGESSCPEVVLRVGTREVLRTRVEAALGRSFTLGASFEAEESATLPVTLELAGGNLELGEATIVRNDLPYTFDAAWERSDVALTVPAVDARQAMPMRFSGDGKQGFLGLLFAGERMVLARAAVAQRGRYVLRLTASEEAALPCGLVARDGSVLVAATCSSGSPAVLDYTGPEAAVGVFVEGVAAGGTEIDDLSIVLESATDLTHCTDAVKSGDESDLDCGGSCPACGDGKACSGDHDCASTRCLDGQCVCRAQTCGELGKECGSVPDGCGGEAACGECGAPSSCGGGGMPNMCGCTAESDAALCTRLGAACGSVTATDNCGSTRAVASCGSCTAPNTCGGGGVPNQCACTAESDAALCARLGKQCGPLTATDNCGRTRTVSSCGTCSSPSTCGGAGVPNMCGVPCVPESDAALCSRRGKNCGAFTATDNCGRSRTVSSCGTCTSPNTCGGGGTANVCGVLLPRCSPAYAQADCLTYVQGTTVSMGGHDWLCSNGNCANCAAFASCAPGGSGCPWGVVWTRQAACRPR